jgi:ATP-dependent DNA ligase
VGEYMFGSEWAQHPKRKGKLFLFDLAELDGAELKNLPYLERYARLFSLHQQGSLPSNWTLVANYESLYMDAIWSRFVLTQEFEGLVFRNPHDTWHQTMLRAKPDFEVDLRVIGFQPGTEGTRLENCLGALLAVDANGTRHVVGGGLTDTLRRAVWSNPAAFLGRWFVCTHKKQFASGQLRHPQFKGWHSDK